uniref:Uncharacterized protein n=1 Tax=Avena sativa TaxID=4498 RepID=A0ACD5ZE11_AVESA
MNRDDDVTGSTHRPHRTAPRVEPNPSPAPPRRHPQIRSHPISNPDWEIPPAPRAAGRPRPVPTSSTCPCRLAKQNRFSPPRDSRNPRTHRPPRRAAPPRYPDPPRRGTSISQQPPILHRRSPEFAASPSSAVSPALRRAVYSTPPPPPPPYPHPHYPNHQRHADEEIRRAAGHHHHNNQPQHHYQHQQPHHQHQQPQPQHNHHQQQHQPQHNHHQQQHQPQHNHHQQQHQPQHNHHHQQQQPTWKEAEDDRRRYTPAHQEAEADRRRYAPAHQEAEADRRRYISAHQEAEADRRRYAPAHQEAEADRRRYSPAHQEAEDSRRRYSSNHQEAEDSRRRYSSSHQEAEDDRRRYAPAHELRLSPSVPRKRQRCALHDGGDLESTSSSGQLRQQPHPNYAPVDSYVDRTSAHPGYSHESLSTHSDSKGSRKVDMPSRTTLSGSPRATVTAQPRHTPQKPTAPRRLSVWQRIEESPASAGQLPKAVHISPSKSNNGGSASKELSSVISVDCKAKSAGSNDGDSTKVIKKDAVKKVLSSVLVKPSPESKEKERDAEKLPAKHENTQKNVSGSPSKSLGLTGRPVAGVKKVKKIVIKKIVRKIGGKDTQISSTIVSEKRDTVDANANASEREEGEIITSSLEKDIISEHNLVSTSDTAGASNGVNVQKGENNNSANSRKRKATSAIESKKILDPVSINGSKHPGKGNNRSSRDPGDTNSASAIKSREALATRRSEHSGKKDRSSMDSGVMNATLAFTNDNHQKEEGEILSLSGEMNATVASNPVKNSGRSEDSSMEESKFPKDTSENNTVSMNGATVNHDVTEICGSEDARREDNDIFIDANEEDARPVSNFIVAPSTTEFIMCERKGAQKNEGMILTGLGGKSISSFGETTGTPRTTEVSLRQDPWEEEGNMLTHPSEKDSVSISCRGTLNTMEFSGNADVQNKEGKTPMESSKGTVTHHVKASNARELDLNEDTRNKESQILLEFCQSNTSKIRHHLEAPNTSEAVMSIFVGREVGKSLVGSTERHAGTTGNSENTPEFSLIGGTDDSHMEDAPVGVEGRDFFNLPSSRNVESRNVAPLDNDRIEDSAADIFSNNSEARGATAQVAELINLHRGHLSTEIDFPLVNTCKSSSVSGNSEQSVPTALTLGSNFYFSNTESERQHEEMHERLEGQKGLDVATPTEFDSLVKRRGVADNDLIGIGAQNWLTLPPTVNSIAMSRQFLTSDVTVREDRIGLDQSMDNDTSVSQDHDVAHDMDPCGSVDAFSSQVNNINISADDVPHSEPPSPKEITGKVENHGGIVLSGLQSVGSINVVDQYDPQMVDIPVGNPNEPAIQTIESTDVMDTELVSPQVSAEPDAGLVSPQVSVEPDAELVSPQVCVEPDHTSDSNAEGPVDDSSTKQALLSSWIESIVSEAKKEHQPCKSTLPSIVLPDKLLAPKEDSRRAVSGLDGNPVVKPPLMNRTSSMPPTVAPKQVTLPSSSREPPRVSSNPRHKTWHRGDMTPSTSFHGSQPSGLPPKQPPRRNDKTSNSYIRKGNALIRNPATGNLSSSLDTQNKLNTPVTRRSMNFVRKVDSSGSVSRSNFTVERPKTPPLPLHAKSINSTTNLSEQLSKTLPKQHVPETEKEDPVGQLNSGVDIPHIQSAQISEPSDATKVVYVRPKSNQLVAAQRQHPDDPINSSMDKVLALQPPTSSDLYFKKRKNQIVLSSSSSDGPITKEAAPAESLNSGENKGVQIASSNNSINGLKGGPHKAFQRTNNMGTFSHVWTLSGQQPQRKGHVGASYMKAFPRILPWKRKVYYKNFGSSHTQNVSSLRIVRKLLQTKKRDTTYTVSTNGFSIRKSAVSSAGGSSLKWSRSLEKCSQKVNEEASLAVANAERKRGEKRKRQSLRYTRRNDQYSLPTAGNQLRNSNQASSDLRKSSSGNEYVRVSKGNQLVRNPKKVIRMLANEKVRWSLHTVRSRLAKKQQYCQFFTRFGECKKPGGKCLYIHDRAKVTICTKFLKGLCSDTSCKLTHKVLPERMQDCSYFLKGLCTNTACPYRHVKVNSNAPVCEDFLKGYCADGDEVLNDITGDLSILFKYYYS